MLCSVCLHCMLHYILGTTYISLFKFSDYFLCCVHFLYKLIKRFFILCFCLSSFYRFHLSAKIAFDHACCLIFSLKHLMY